MWSREEIWKNVSWGVRRGIFYSGVYTLLFVAFCLLGGRASLVRKGQDPLLILLFYLLGPLLAGGVIGLLRPLTHTLAGRMLTGAVAAVPVALGTYLIVIPGDLWAARLLPFTLATAFVLGPIFGAADFITDGGDRKS